mmetsp:Transcript_4228/g.9875  ORF Transcript_4228/g.9875 Transcript_4228/m.9875 type:complete len:399 (-) Transcript_4228:859-2055(-)
MLQRPLAAVGQSQRLPSLIADHGGPHPVHPVGMQGGTHRAAQPNGGQHFVVEQRSDPQPVDGCYILCALDTSTDDQFHIHGRSCPCNPAALLEVVGVVGEADQHRARYCGHGLDGVADWSAEGGPLAVREVGCELANQPVSGQLRQCLEIVSSNHNLCGTGIQPSCGVTDFQMTKLHLAPVSIDQPLESGLASVQYFVVSQENLPDPGILLHQLLQIPPGRQHPILQLDLSDHREDRRILHHLRASGGPKLHPSLSDHPLDIRDRQHPIVEDRCSESGLCPHVECFHHVVRRLAPAASDHWDVTHGLHDRAGKLAVVPLAGAVSVPASQQNLASTEADTLGGPTRGILPSLVPASPDYHVVIHVAARLSLASVDSEDHTLTPECLGQLRDELGPLHRG